MPKMAPGTIEVGVGDIILLLVSAPGIIGAGVGIATIATTEITTEIATTEIGIAIIAKQEGS